MEFRASLITSLAEIGPIAQVCAVSSLWDGDVECNGDVTTTTRQTRVLDQKLKEEYDVELIAPHRSRRTKRTQDRRKLRRYKKRWRVERLFAWFHNFRRLVTRWEYHVENFLGMVHLACLKLLLKHL